MKHILTMILMLSMALFVFSYSEESREPEAKYYDQAKVLRIKFVEGEGFVQRSYEEGNEEATINLPIFEKDLVGTTEGRIEIYLGRQNFLRLDSDTRIQLNKVPSLRQTDLTLRIQKGGIYLDIADLENEKDIEIQTPDCGIFLLESGTYRINVREGHETEVYVHEGTAEVAGNRSSRNIREDQKIVMAEGDIVERPYYFYASDRDEFDRWNQERNSAIGYARYGSSRYLQSGYEDYESELSRYGRWSYRSEFGCYSWMPYSIGMNWRPYYHGRWVWSPWYGYVWTSYDSWGWFTHHYGRWHWDPYDGWYWLPGYHWSPAWVHWFWDDYYYGWCPVSWWNRPIIIVNNRWNHGYQYWNGIPIHSRSTIIIRKNELSAANIHQVALKEGALSQLSKKAIDSRGNAPAERMPISKVNVTNAAGKSVIYKQEGIVSSDRYRSSGSEGKVVSTTPAAKKDVFKYSSSEGTERKEKTTIRYSGSERSRDGSDDSSKVKTKKEYKSYGYSSGARQTTETSESSDSTSSSSSVRSSSTKSSTSQSSGRATKKKKDDGSPSFSTSYSSDPAETPSAIQSDRPTSSSRYQRYGDSYSDDSKQKFKSSSSYRPRAQSSYQSDETMSSNSSRRAESSYESRNRFSSEKSYQPIPLRKSEIPTRSYTPTPRSYSTPDYSRRSSSSSSSYSSPRSSPSYSTPRSSSSSWRSSASSSSTRSSSTSSSGHATRKKD